MSKQYLELWSGKIPLFDVNWTFLQHKKFDFSNEFLKDKNRYWKKYILQFPQLYDGDLLFLDDFSVEGKRMELTTRSIKFSTLTYMISKNIKLSESLGSLGFQLFVCDPKGEKFLLGERSQSSEYKPGHYTIPGGMFEVEDSIDSVANACLREIKEELYLDLDPNTLIGCRFSRWFFSFYLSFRQIAKPSNLNLKLFEILSTHQPADDCSHFVSICPLALL